MPRPKRDLEPLYMNIPKTLSSEVVSYGSSIGLNKTDAICLLLRKALEIENSKGKTAEEVKL